MRLTLILLVLVLVARAASAQNAISVDQVRVDRATHHTIGIQVLIAGDANRNATISVQVRLAGETMYRDAPALFRVFPETVTTRTVPEQFAGTIFDLAPGTTYEIALAIIDPDGGNDTRTLTATTRPWPADPVVPRAVTVTNEVELNAALQDADAGDVITIADGTYNGTFVLLASGTRAAPIVLRGATRDGVILNGLNCGDCNVLEVAGSHVHVEKLTIRNGVRGLRFLNATTGNAVLGTRIENVVHGIGSAPNQSDFTLCDNLVHGRLVWPLISSDDMAIHNDDQGIRVDGSGHVVCHNDITGFGDPLINFAEGARAYDFYGNDIHEIYGDGVELDRAEGNARLWGNRFTNVFTAISMQPIHGGPAYVLRNVALNVADEQIKLKSLGGTVEPSGALIFHNTFISPGLALNLQTPIAQHNFVVANNIFVGPETPAGGRTVEWTAVIDRGVFDGNGYWPDAGFWFGTVNTPRSFPNLAGAQAVGIELDGRVLSLPIFASGLVAPSTYIDKLALPDVALDPSSNAIDAALALPGINGRSIGGIGDLGARERGCPAPIYGPRPSGSLLTNIVDCGIDDPDPTGDAGTDPGPDSPPDSDGGCCQAQRDLRGGVLLGLAVALWLRRRKRAQP